MFKQHNQTNAEVGVSSHVIGDLGIDSLGIMEVVAEIEDTFKLMIPDDALRHVNTIGDVIAAVEAQLTEDGRISG